LIGVAPGERQRRDGEDDADPAKRFPTRRRRTVAEASGRNEGKIGHQVPLCAPLSATLEGHYRRKPRNSMAALALNRRPVFRSHYL
jgi:hypothetical protein